MQALSSREALLERRNSDYEKQELWNNLTLAQTFSASSLTQFGYDLAFVRNKNNNSLAVLLCNGNPATITAEGEIDTSPQIVIRP